MKSVGHGDVKVANRLRAAFVGGKAGGTGVLGFEPEIRFESSENLRFELLRESKHVSHVIAVPVGQKDSVQARQLLQGFGTRGIGHYPGIDQSELTAGRGKTEGAVTEIRDFVAFEVEHDAVPFIFRDVPGKLFSVNCGLANAYLESRV